ncbi:hypothetical protein P280DRAFT_291603 [Massarina eburnea CBS 473.64]|uniref:Uncharacterized protein n=1 Tax=Massarina eburnea CBS 473.64 TaxID=1395130 RepID=A0A6A6S433_9PLEO|nr:hypothetical protein P280DRAFT_291603 [Massarina eburnea CBS 473.64]
MTRLIRFKTYLSALKTSSKASRKPLRPSDLALKEPITASFESNYPTSPLSGMFQIQVTRDFSQAQAQPEDQTKLHEPRSITINISDLSAPPRPSSPAAKDPQFTKLLSRTSSRRLSRRISKLHVRPATPSALKRSRPNSFFGAGLDLPIEDLESIVEEVNEMSSRHPETSRGMSIEGKPVEVDEVEALGYVPLS